MEILVPKYSILIYRSDPFYKRLWNMTARLYSSSPKYKNEYIIKFLTEDLHVDKSAHDLVLFRYIGPDKTGKMRNPKRLTPTGVKDNNTYEFEKLHSFDNNICVPNDINYKTVICLMESLKNWQKNII